MEEMTEDQRERFAKAVASRVVGMGSKRAVYQAADVSPQTLERVLDGQSVKPFTVAALVTALWPQANGDWRRVYGVRRQEHPVPGVPRSLDDYVEIQTRLIKRRLESIEKALIEAGLMDKAGEAFALKAANDPHPSEPLYDDGFDPATEEDEAP